MLTEKLEKRPSNVETQKVDPTNEESIAPPYELDEIMLKFGNIFDYINYDGTIKPGWEIDQMGLVGIPFSIPLAFCPSLEVDKIYCHKKLISTFTRVFQAIHENHLQKYIRSFGGCYTYRNKYTQTQLSAHSWGIAIDLNPETNMPCSRGDMNPEIVRIFRSYGFEWGGDWKRRNRNPMHFQWCTGY
jgi:hypothetical protein